MEVRPRRLLVSTKSEEGNERGSTVVFFGLALRIWERVYGGTMGSGALAMEWVANSDFDFV